MEEFNALRHWVRIKMGQEAHFSIEKLVHFV